MRKHHNKKLRVAGIALALAALACNLPGRSAPTPFVFPTPDFTMTAIFSPPLIASATSLPTEPLVQPATSLPETVPTATLQPSPTTVPVVPTATQFLPTPTRFATRTPMPTVSYAGPAVRKGGSVSVIYRAQKPIIDGEFSDWKLERYSVTSVVAGGSRYTGEEDLSAKVMFAWDDNNLYLAARVKDDRYVQNADGEELFKGDSIEILIDTDVAGDYYFDELNGDDFQIGMSPGISQPGNAPEAYLWFPKAKAGAIDRVKVGATRVDDGYRIEASIPWSELSIIPRKGQHFGFAFSVSDNDAPGEKVQQSMVSTAPRRALLNPASWGNLTLAVAQPQTRTAGSVEALYIKKAPSLDADLGEWEVKSYPVNHVVFGKDRWDGGNDLTGNLMAAWDDDYLYLGIWVVDNRYVQNASGEALFLGDSLEVLFDADVAGDFYDRRLSQDDFQLGISPGSPVPGQDPEAYLWFPKSQAGRRSKVQIAAAATTNDYSVEVAIPWSIFGILPGRGLHFGFVFSISDNDNLDKDVQQSMVSNLPARVLTDPTTWGDLTLTRP